MNRKQLLHSIRNLSKDQCEQLGVVAPFKGQGGLKAVEAWLGDATLLDADGNALPLEAIFEDGDPAEVSLHAGMPMTEEAEEATEEASEMTADEESVQEMVTLSVRNELAKRKHLALPRTSGIKMKSSQKKSSHFESSEDQYLAGQWIGAKLFNMPSAKKWWNNNAPSGLKAQATSPDSAGGYLVPSPLEASILDVRSKYGLCRRVSHLFPMSSDTLDVPSLTSGSTVYYPAQNASITESSAVWGNVALATVTRASLMKYSNQIGDDALFSMADTLSDYIGRGLASREDQEFIQGDGTTDWGSVYGLGNVVGRQNVDGAGATWASLTLANLIDVVGTLADKYHAGASWIMSRQFYSQVVLRLIADAGGNTIDSLGVGTTGVQFLGYPVNFSDHAPIATAINIEACYFGNWSDGVAFGDRQGVQIATSEHVNFAENQVNIRGTARYDIKVHDVNAYVCLSTT